MASRRQLWIGLGIGLMLGSAMLELMITGQTQANAGLPEKPSIDSLRKEAEAMNYSLHYDKSPTYSQAELDKAVKAAREEAGSLQASPTPAPAGKSEASPAPSDTPEPVTSPVPSAKPSPSNSIAKDSVADEHKIMFYIAEGDSLEEVATALKAGGLITNKADFVLKAKPYSKSLRVGLCTFQGKPDYKAIIAEITRRKV